MKNSIARKPVLLFTSRTHNNKLNPTHHNKTNNKQKKQTRNEPPKIGADDIVARNVDKLVAALQITDLICRNISSFCSQDHVMQSHYDMHSRMLWKELSLLQEPCSFVPILSHVAHLCSDLTVGSQAVGRAGAATARLSQHKADKCVIMRLQIRLHDPDLSRWRKSNE